MSEKIIIQNKKAYYDYNIIQEIEAGIVLVGSEVKSLREGKVSIIDSFIYPKNGEFFKHALRIPKLKKSTYFSHDPDRIKKLLLNKSEVNKLLGQVKKTGNTIVPLKIYFNKKNIIKILIALVSGKQLHDKRQTIKEREWNRNKHRVLKKN